MNKLGITVTLASVITLEFAALPVGAAPVPSGPFNRIVVLVDATDSFKQRRLDAIDRTQQLVHQLSTRRAKRWEAADQVVIISLDAIPEVLWEGDARALVQAKRGDWATRFKARSDYARCTDVQAALDLALASLERAPQPAGKYLIGFSDLIHEPPLQSPSTCKPQRLPSVPAKDFAWDRLADVSVAMFWLPPGQKLAWDRAMKEAGLSTFKLYTNSESGAIEIDLPKPAMREVSEQDLERVNGALRSGAWVVAQGVAGLILAIALGAGSFLLVLRHRNRRVGGVGAAPVSATNAGQRLAGDVPPMTLPLRH